MGCAKRRRVQDRGLQDGAPTHGPSVLPANWIVVNCRGTRFETSLGTIKRLGSCYLTSLTEISSIEDVRLDFSPASFQRLLDVLIIAQHDLAGALLLASRSKTSIPDFPS